MSDNEENFGGTKLVGENGERMDPALAGMSPSSVPTTEGDAAGAADGNDMEDDAAGAAEMKALDEEDSQADVTASGAE